MHLTLTKDSIDHLLHYLTLEVGPRLHKNPRLRELTYHYYYSVRTNYSGVYPPKEILALRSSFLAYENYPERKPMIGYLVILQL